MFFGQHRNTCHRAHKGHEARNATETGESELLDRALIGNRAGFGTLRCPVFGREGYPPEGGARCCEFQTYLCLATAHGTEIRHVAFLFFFGFVVPHMNHGAADDPRSKQYQPPVGVNGESLCEFLEVLSLSVLPAQADADLHQHALAAALGARMRGYGCTRDLSHTTSLQNNYTVWNRIVESIPGCGIQ